jgi:hypothetical protein
MPKRITIEEVKKRLENNHNGRVSIVESTFIGMNYPANFVDVEHGEWRATAAGVINGHRGHKIRGNKKRKLARKMSADEVSVKVESISGGEVVLDKSSFRNTYTKARFIDKKYGIGFTRHTQIVSFGIKID